MATIAGGMLAAAGVLAQESDGPASPADELAARIAALHILTGAERIASRIVHVESVALLSERGDWPPETRDWSATATVPKFVYDVSNLRRRRLPELIALRRGAGRPGVFDAAERERIEQDFNALQTMIDDTTALYQMLAEDRPDEADDLFRVVMRSQHAAVMETTFTIGVSVTRDIAGLTQEIRAAH